VSGVDQRRAGGRRAGVALLASDVQQVLKDRPDRAAAAAAVPRLADGRQIAVSLVLLIAPDCCSAVFCCCAPSIRLRAPPPADRAPAAG